jgi:hypothetical protein
MVNRPMTQHPGRRPERVRLSVVAALVGSSVPADPATADESRLADALGRAPGEPGGTPGPDAPALADLLRLAEGTPSSGAFVTGLQQAFLIPDDSRHALAREDTTAAFADLYRRLAMPGLSGEAGSRALAILRKVATT